MAIALRDPVDRRRVAGVDGDSVPPSEWSTTDEGFPQIRRVVHWFCGYPSDGGTQSDGPPGTIEPRFIGSSMAIRGPIDDRRRVIGASAGRRRVTMDATLRDDVSLRKDAS
ncbi:MAG TPA: hypothetical protein VIF84_01595 [Candidatus Limnocylindrales bacterium]